MRTQTGWKHTIDIKEAWAKAFEQQMSIKDLVKAIEEKTRSVLPANLFEESKPFFDKMNALPLTSDLSDVEDFDPEDFDDAMSDWYDWANERRVRIKTAGWQ